MSAITLIGTVHVDYKGHKRLEKALQHYKPAIVCLEETPQSATNAWKMHLDRVQKLKEIPWERVYTPEQVERVKAEFISSSYELWVPKIYKNSSTDVRLYCIDRDYSAEVHGSINAAQGAWVMRELASGKRIQDLMNHFNVNLKDFVDHGSIEEHQFHVDREYDKTDTYELIISRYGEAFFNMVVTERDRRFAEQIRKIHADNPDKSLVAVLGNGHFFTGYANSTYNLLSDLNPTRMKLKDADRF